MIRWSMSLRGIWGIWGILRPRPCSTMISWTCQTYNAYGRLDEVLASNDFIGCWFSRAASGRCVSFHSRSCLCRAEFPRPDPKRMYLYTLVCSPETTERRTNPRDVVEGRTHPNPLQPREFCPVSGWAATLTCQARMTTPAASAPAVRRPSWSQSLHIHLPTNDPRITTSIDAAQLMD